MGSDPSCTYEILALKHYMNQPAVPEGMLKIK